MSQIIKTYFVDSFTRYPFKGNPAGVCVLEKELDEEQYKTLRINENKKERTAGNFLMSYFLHEREHFGVIQYIQGLSSFQEMDNRQR